MPLYRRIAVLTGIVVQRGSFRDEKGEVKQFGQRSRYADGRVRRGKRWQMVASHPSDWK